MIQISLDMNNNRDSKFSKYEYGILVFSNLHR